MVANNSVFRDTNPIGTVEDPSLTPGSSLVLNGTPIEPPENPLLLSDVVSEINNAGITGVSAEITNLGSGQIIEIDTTVDDLVIGRGPQDFDLVEQLGLRPDTYYGPHRRKAITNHPLNTSVSLENPLRPSSTPPGTAYDQRLECPGGYITPTITAPGPLGGALDTWIRFAPNDVGQRHCMFRVYNEALLAGNVPYLKPNTHYRYTFVAHFNDEVVDNTLWCIPVQVHPGDFPSTWTGTKNPPLALYVQNGDWILRVRGAAGASATSYTDFEEATDTSNTVPGVKDNGGYHSVVLDFVFDSENSQGSAVCTIDGNVLGQPYSGIRLGVWRQVNMVPQAGTLTCGTYASVISKTKGDEPRVQILLAELEVEN